MSSSRCFTKVERKKGKMKIVTIHMPEQYVDDLKRLVEEGKYASMSEAIRVAVRRFLHRRTRNISKRMIA